MKALIRVEQVRAQTHQGMGGACESLFGLLFGEAAPYSSLTLANRCL